jgi:hypothetical protein
MPLFRRVVASGLVVLVAVQATGCTSWKTVPQPVPAAVAQYPKRQLKVVLRDGRTTVADSVKTDTATVYAYLTYAVQTIPLAEVKEVKVREARPARAVAWGLAVLAFVAVVVIILYSSYPLCAEGGSSC